MPQGLATPTVSIAPNSVGGPLTFALSLGDRVMVLPSACTCKKNTNAAGGWTWLPAEARKCGQVVIAVLFFRQRHACCFVTLLLCLEHIWHTLVCSCSQVGIVDKLHLQYPNRRAGYYVKFADGDRQSYVHANLRLATNLIGRAGRTNFQL